MNTPVNFEIAKVLREKGFDNLCDYYYSDAYGAVHRITLHQFQVESNQNSNLLAMIYTAPTIAEVVMWLYEEHSIWIGVTFDNVVDNNIFYSTISIIKEGKFMVMYNDNNNINFNTPTEAYEFTILHTLNNYVNFHNSSMP